MARFRNEATTSKKKEEELNESLRGRNKIVKIMINNINRILERVNLGPIDMDKIVQNHKNLTEDHPGLKECSKMMVNLQDAITSILLKNSNKIT